MHFPWVIDVSVTKKNDNSKNFPSRVIDIGWIYIHVGWGGGSEKLRCVKHLRKTTYMYNN